MRVSLVSLLAIVAVVAGCTNECEDATNRVEERYDDCGFALPGDLDLDVDVDCEDSVQSEYDCVADCAEEAPCGAIDGSDEEAEADYLDCRDACT